MFNKIQILTRKEIRKISEAKLVVNAAFLSPLIAFLVLIAELGYNSMKAGRDKTDGGFALWSHTTYLWTHEKGEREKDRGRSERKRGKERDFTCLTENNLVHRKNNQER